jgi:hypothetical protein
MKTRAFAVGFAAAVLVLASHHALSTGTVRAAQTTPALAPDKGTFRILSGSAEVGTEQFELAAAGNAWVVRSESVIRVPDSGETRSTAQLRFAANGMPLHYDWTSQTQKKVSGSVVFENGTAKTCTNLDDKNPTAKTCANLDAQDPAAKTNANSDAKDPYQQDFMFPSPRVAVLDNNLFYPYVVLAHLYDWNAKGAQEFPVLIPQDLTPGSITIESLGPKTVGGASLEMLRVRSADLEVIAYFDARRRLMRLEVPAAKVAVVRQ